MVKTGGWFANVCVEPGSGKNAGDQTNIFPVDGDRRSKLKS